MCSLPLRGPHCHQRHGATPGASTCIKPCHSECRLGRSATLWLDPLFGCRLRGGRGPDDVSKSRRLGLVVCRATCPSRALIYARPGVTPAPVLFAAPARQSETVRLQADDQDAGGRRRRPRAPKNRANCPARPPPSSKRSHRSRSEALQEPPATNLTPRKLVVGPLTSIGRSSKATVWSAWG
jgi:hypothetical protein